MVLVLSFLLAHRLYPLRIRVVNVISGEEEWQTVAYIPVTRKEKEPAAAERARLRRSGVSQRVVYLAFRSAIGASHAGVEFDGLGDRTLRAFPRILLFLCDQPEERAVLCLKSGICDYPCSMCNVSAKEFGAEQALAAGDREVVLSLERQVKAAKLLRAGKDNRRLAHLEEYGSLQSCVPALASMAGLSTAPFCWYRMMGLDALLVRTFCFSLVHDALFYIFWKCEGGGPVADVVVRLEEPTPCAVAYFLPTGSFCRFSTWA